MIPRERRTNRQNPCPVCGHADWCIVLPGGDAVWCGRADSFNGRRGIPRKGGWVHRIGNAQPVCRPTPTPPRKPLRLHPAVDFAALAKKATDAVTPAMARSLACDLGVNVTSLRRLGVGRLSRAQVLATGTRCRSDGVWSFPMRDGEGRICGIRLRTDDGFKYSIDSSDGCGLFIPQAIGTGDQLLVPEGPTNSAALLTLRFATVGRPNSRAGVEYLAALIRRLAPSRVVVVGDNDPPDRMGRRPGADGALYVRGFLSRTHPDVRAMFPPELINDSRDWLMAGATAAEVQWRIDHCGEGLRRDTRHAG